MPDPRLLRGPLNRSVPPAGHSAAPAPGPEWVGRARQSLRHRLAAGGIALAIGLSVPAASAAESIVFVSGAFRRSIPVSDLVHLAETGQARGLLQDVLRLGRQDPGSVARLLNQSVSLPVVLMSRLLNTRIGEVLLQRLSQIVYPLKASSSGLPALRAAVILGSSSGGAGLTPISFLRAYPSQELAVSLPALMGLLSKSGSITDLVRFFSESPLDGLRGEAPGNGPNRSPNGGSGQAPADPAPSAGNSSTGDSGAAATPVRP